MEIYHETKSELLNEAFGEVEPPRTSERRRSTRQAAQEVEEDEEVMGPSRDVKRIYNSSTQKGLCPGVKRYIHNYLKGLSQCVEIFKYIKSKGLSQSVKNCPSKSTSTVMIALCCRYSV